MTWHFSQHSDEEGLRLIVAFLKITDPAIRMALVELAERAAQQGPCPPTEPSEFRQDNERL